MVIKLSSLLAAAALASMVNADCTASGNADTNSAIDCKYLNPCTVEASQVPTSPSGYTIECETMPCPANQDIMFDKIEGTDIGELLGASCDNTVEQCQAACEQTGGCCGFNFVYNPGQYGADVGRCVAKACDGRIGTSRYGMVYYERDAGAVPTQSPTVAPEDDGFDDLESAAAAVGGALIVVFIVIPLLVIACICVCCYFMLKKNNNTTVVVAQGGPGAPVQMQPQTQMQP